jgi:DNA-binding CsgD family transcriptional regulator
LEIGRGHLELAGECLAEAREAYLRTVTQAWFATPLFVATAELALLQGRLDDADRAVAEGLQVATGDLAFAAPLYVIGVRAAAERAEFARARRAEAEIAKASEVGEELAREFALRMSPERTDGSVSTPRIRAYAVLGDAELTRLAGRSDAELWEKVADSWDRLSEPYPAAYARWREAEALLLAGVARGRAEALLRAADATARGLGALPLCTDIEGLARRGRVKLDIDQARGRVITESSSPLTQLGLTAREQEVLILMATGATNRQIAERLFISPKTATLHVSNILSKLGVSNRVEAATIAHRLGA